LIGDHFHTDRSGPEQVEHQLEQWLLQLGWVAEAEVRLREEGHVFFGECFVRPIDSVADLPRRVRVTMDEMKNLNWRLHDVTIAVVDRLREPKSSQTTSRSRSHDRA
jgi:hypothetical protein